MVYFLSHSEETMSTKEIGIHWKQTNKQTKPNQTKKHPLKITTNQTIFTNPWAQAGYDTRSIFKRSLAD